MKQVEPALNHWKRYDPFLVTLLGITFALFAVDTLYGTRIAFFGFHNFSEMALIGFTGFVLGKHPPRNPLARKIVAVTVWIGTPLLVAVADFTLSPAKLSLDELLQAMLLLSGLVCWLPYYAGWFVGRRRRG